MTVSGMGQILAGSVTLMGRPVPKLRQAHRVARWGVMHVPENRGLLFQLTVRENLEMAKTRGRVDIDRAVDFFPALGPLMNRRGGLLSGGEQQMLVLGRAIVADRGYVLNHGDLVMQGQPPTCWPIGRCSTPATSASSPWRTDPPRAGPLSGPVGAWCRPQPAPPACSMHA